MIIKEIIDKLNEMEKLKNRIVTAIADITNTDYYVVQDWLKEKDKDKFTDFELELAEKYWKLEKEIAELYNKEV